MKIEKISDNQIRCTLTSDDLASRHIKLSELAYGTEKAKNLFQDMMQQAWNEVGFEASSAPLMIEAIPVAPDSIVLIITRVDDPEELDTRFSRFSPSSEDMEIPKTKQFSGADDILDLFQKIYDAKVKARQEAQASAARQENGNAPADRNLQTGQSQTISENASAADCNGKTGNPADPDKTASGNKAGNSTNGASDNKAGQTDIPINLVQAFRFHSLDDVIRSARALQNFYEGENTLYKTGDGEYRLILHQSGSSPEDFNKICNILSEYGSIENSSAAGEAHLKEHNSPMVAGEALQKLSQL